MAPPIPAGRISLLTARRIPRFGAPPETARFECARLRGDAWSETPDDPPRDIGRLGPLGAYPLSTPLRPFDQETSEDNIMGIDSFTLSAATVVLAVRVFFFATLCCGKPI